MKFDIEKWNEEAEEESCRWMDYPESSVSKLFDEIERLEKEVEILKKKSEIDPSRPKFVAMKEGNGWHFSLPDFVNLQESNSIFLPTYDVDMDYIYMLVLQNNATNRLWGTK